MIQRLSDPTSTLEAQLGTDPQHILASATPLHGEDLINPFSPPSSLRIQDLSPLRNYKQQRQASVGSPQSKILNNNHSSPLKQQLATPQKRQSPNSNLSKTLKKSQIIHSRSRAFEKSPEGSQFYRNQSVLFDLNSPLENKENDMEISPGNESSPKSLNLGNKTQSTSPYRKVLSPISPNQLMEDSPQNHPSSTHTLTDLQRKKPASRYSPYMVNSPQQPSKSSLRSMNHHHSPRLNHSPLLRFATTTGSQKKKSPLYLSSQHHVKTPIHHRKRNPSPKNSISQQQHSSNNNHPNNNHTLPVTMKPIQFEPPTSSVNDCSPIASCQQPKANSSNARFVQSPFKTPSYYKKRQALAEDLSLAYEDSYSRSAKKNALKNPFTSPNIHSNGSNSFKQIHVIPDKAYKMMVGNAQQQMNEKIHEIEQQQQQSKKKSLIRSMKDYRKNKLESLKNKLREQRTLFMQNHHHHGHSNDGTSLKCTNMETMQHLTAQQASSSFSSTGSDKKKSPARKRKYDETDENLQGGASMVRSLGAVLTQNPSQEPSMLTLETNSRKDLQSSNALPAQSALLNSFMQDQDEGLNPVDSDHDNDDDDHSINEEVIVEEEHKMVESPTKKLKSDQGRPLWSRLKKALTRKPNILNENENSKMSGSVLKRKLSKKSLMLAKQKQNSASGEVTSTSASNLISYAVDQEHQSNANVSNQGPLKKQKSFGEHYFSSLVHGFRHKDHSESSSNPTCEDDMKLKNRQFQIQDNLQEKFMTNMKETFTTGENLTTIYQPPLLLDSQLSNVTQPFKVPSLNLKSVPPLSLKTLENTHNLQNTPRGNAAEEMIVPIPSALEESREKSFSYNFVETIHTPHHREYFIKHCEKEYNSENIEFWCEVRLKYEFLRNRAQRYEHAIKLLNGYVELTSDKAINIDKKSILLVKTRVKDETDDLVDLFEPITKHIETVMQDAFKRFQLSPLYQEMISHHKQLLEKNSIGPTSTDLDTPRGAHANFKSKVINFLSPKGILHH
ncbi:hypothetical protein C9374_002817 [Naegleria lovaniensis]|uniref:RGS domain-containing protein n=1 Tax=Naegleria lovaniensis TaxID=51637 RepID=A0AA88GQ81_NAELO|nr:uncharacterized protein C9374_002817 [Naegleria lovaniensis]KAG2386371.1 hypothetical protein C9374_002817 [Naegleria lovaniensis]